MIDGYEVKEFHLTPSARVTQTYVYTAEERAIELDDQDVELYQDDDASAATFVDVQGHTHQLILHQVTRHPLRFPLGE